MMSEQRKSLPIALATALLLLAVPRKASAYVDPGSGAMLWQLAAASVVGALFYLKAVTGWISRHTGLRSARSMGFLFATGYALVASPVVLAVFNARPVPRFNDIFVVGIVLAAYLFTWESAVYLLVISIGFSAYVMHLHFGGTPGSVQDVYRLISFAAICVFLIHLITRMKSRIAKSKEGCAVAVPASSRRD